MHFDVVHREFIIIPNVIDARRTMHKIDKIVHGKKLTFN